MAFEKFDVMSVELKSGEIRCKLGDSSTDTGERDDAVWWGLPGFYAMPKVPNDDGACNVLFDNSGHTRRVLAGKDNRIVAKYGSLAEGDRAIVGYRDARFLMKDSSDSISLMTKNHAANDETMLFQFNGEQGNLTVMIGGSDGTTLIKAKSGMIHMAVDGGGSLTLDKDGVHVTGNTFDCATGGGNLGVLGAIPPPIGTNSILLGVSGQTGMPSTKWTITS